MEWHSQPSFSQGGLSHSQPVYSHHLYDGRESQAFASQAPSYEHPPVPQSYHSHARYASQPNMSSCDPDDHLLVPAATPGSGFSLARVQSPSSRFAERPYSSQPHSLMPVTMLAQRFAPQAHGPGLASRTTPSHEWARSSFDENGRSRAGLAPQSHPYQNHPQRWVRDPSRPQAVPLRQQVTTSQQPIETAESNCLTPSSSRSEAVRGPAEATAQIDSQVPNFDAAAGAYTRLLNAAIPTRSLPFGTTKKAEPLAKNTSADELQNAEEHRLAPRGKQVKQATGKRKAAPKVSASKAKPKEPVVVHETADQETTSPMKKTLMDTGEKIKSVKNDNKKRPSTATKRTKAPPAKRARTKTLQKSSQEVSRRAESLPLQATAEPTPTTTQCSPLTAGAVGADPAAKAPSRQRKRTGVSQNPPPKTKPRSRTARKPQAITATTSVSVLRTASGRSMARSTIPEVGDKVSATESPTAKVASPITPPPGEAVDAVPRSTTPELVSLLREVERVAKLDSSDEPSLLNAMMGLQQVEIVLQGKLQQGDLHRLASSSGCKYLMSYEI